MMEPEHGDRGTDGERVRRLVEENERLKRAVEELSVLNELAREISASLDSSDVMERIVRRSIRALGAEQGVISLVDEGAAEPTRTLVRTSSSSSERPPMRANRLLLGWMHLHGRPIRIDEPRRDERFSGAQWDDDVRSVLCVPLLVRSRLVGILTVFNKKGRTGFSEEDQRLLTIIAAQSAQVVENARLHEEEKALLQVRQELRLAADIQRRLLPQRTPALDGYELAGRSLPAQHVGGDYYDFLEFPDGKVGVCVADVSGKGLAAALLMSNIQAALRARYDETVDPAACLETIGRLLHRSTRRGSFVSMIYGILDSASHTITYANAGHNRPLLCRPDGSVQRLDTAGIVLGAIETPSYQPDTVELEPGSLLLLYSDGVTEAMDERRRQFGEDLLIETLRAARSESAESVLDAIMGQIGEHAAGADQHDDVTMLAIRRT